VISLSSKDGLITKIRNLERVAQALAPREHEIYLIYFRVFALSSFRDNLFFLVLRLRWIRVRIKQFQC
jgi:hypothetical protein